MVAQISKIADSPVIAIIGAGAALANPGGFIPLALKDISETDPSTTQYIVEWVFFALVSLLPLAAGDHRALRRAELGETRAARGTGLAHPQRTHNWRRHPLRALPIAAPQRHLGSAQLADRCIDRDAGGTLDV